MSDNHKRAVIWDLDGTLIDSSHLHWEAWQKVMEDENIALTYEQYVADFGKRNDEILRGRLGADCRMNSSPASHSRKRRSIAV